MTSVLDDLEAELGPEKPKNKAKSAKSSNGSGQSWFDLVNAIPVIEVLNWLGIEHKTHGEKIFVECKGCGNGLERSDVVVVDNAVKCPHKSCEDAGPSSAPGLRTNVDLTMLVHGVESLEAVKMLAEHFNLELPRSNAKQKDDPYHQGPRQDNEEQQAGKGNEPPPKEPRTVSDILADWNDEGHTERVDTGIPTFDAMCGGGMPIPRRVLFTGAPGAAKTYSVVWLVEQFLTRLAEFGFLLGIVAIDEDDTDLLVRFAQMRGFTPEQLEARSEDTLAQIATEFEGAPLRFYGLEWSLDASAENLAAWGKELNRPCALIVDSIHTAWSVAGVEANNVRESIEANFKVLKQAHRVHRMTVITTGEMNRQGYGSEKQAADANLLASNAETRAAEFWAQTHVALRTPKDLDGIVECTVTKNRGINTKKGKFWLKLLHEKHDIQEVGDPNENPEFIQKQEEKKAKSRSFKNLKDARQLGKFMLPRQGITTKKLRTAVKLEPTMGWGTERLNTALEIIRSGDAEYELRDDTKGNAHEYYVTLRAQEDTNEPTD